MTRHSNQARLLASALYEIRILLSGYLGSDNPGEVTARQAASLAYALHNQAEALALDQDFDPSACVAALRYVDHQFDSDYLKRFAPLLDGKS